MSKKRGFTLAEVLVTLAVIGVVAALTIPTIIQSSTEKQAKTSVKKAISVMNQILAMSIAEDGVGGGEVNNTGDLKDLFGNYMKIQSYDNVNNAFSTADGMIYTFYHDGSNPCGSSANPDNDPASANCIIEIDINGNNGANVASSKGNYSDLYYLIVNDNTVSPANADGTWQPATLPLRADSGTVDDVALDALMN